jgi:hypothetical protein
MKIIATLALLILPFYIAQSQLCSAYSFSSSKNEEFRISLYNNGLYEMARYYDNGDMSDETYLSYGKYIHKNGMITFFDSCNSYQMVFAYTPRYLLAEKALSWFFNKRFYFSGSLDSKSRPVFAAYGKDKNYKSLKLLRTEYKGTQKNVRAFVPGVYEGDGTAVATRLFL